MAYADTRFCITHRTQSQVDQLSWPALGAAVGSVLLPGAGGFVVGALAGIVGRSLQETLPTPKKPIFVSFDFDQDLALKHLIVAQAKLPDSPFSIVDHSLKEAAPEETWADKARNAIKRSELVLVVVGQQTYRAPGVLKEVQMAREEGVKVVQMIGQKHARYKPVKGAGTLYAWNWKNLKALLN
jgi:hypothetical protein